MTRLPDRWECAAFGAKSLCAVNRRADSSDHRET
jgi:hypothetical protein